MSSEGRQRAAEVLQDAAIVNYKTVVFSFVNAVCSCNRLHQRVCLERFVKIERRQAFYVKSGEPHRTNNGDAKGMVVSFERGFNIDPLTVIRFKAFLDEFPVLL